MKKHLLLFVLLVMTAGSNAWATKKYADLSQDVSLDHVTWTASTHTLTWDLGYSNSFALSGLSGDLSEYTTITINASGYSSNNEYRLIFYGPNFPEDANGNHQMILGAFYSNGGTYNLADRGFTKEMLSDVTSINLAGASGSGSIVINRIYLEKPTKFTFNDAGKAYLYPSDLTATSWGLDSYDDETGIVTKTTTGYGGISFDFGETGYDFSDITNIEISIDANHDDIRDYANVKDVNDHIQYINATGGSYSLLGSEIDSNIKQWNLGFNAKTGTMKINYVCFTSNVITATNGSEKDIRTATSYQKDGDAYVVATSYTPSYRVNEETNVAYFGVDWSGENLNYYTDLTGYDKLRVYQESSTPIVRPFFENANASGHQNFQDDCVWNSEGYYELDLAKVQSAVGNLHLTTLRPASGATGKVTRIVVTDKNSQYNYVISGSGVENSSVSAALADPSATMIDATGVTGTNISLTSANPNCIFVANAGALANTNNVCVDGTIENLVLTDNNPFAAPAGAEAATATYTRTMPNAFGTICLPYAVSSTEAVKYYNATGIDADGALQLEAMDEVPAGTPAIVYVAAAGDITLTGSGALADAKEKNGDVSLTGSFSAQSIDVESAAANYYGISDNQFVQATKTLNVKPFRAYLTTPKSAGAKLRIGLPSETATAISTLTAEDATVEAIYNMAGALQNGLQKGLNIVKMSNGRTTKVFVK